MPEKKRVYVDKAVAAKSEEACKKPIERHASDSTPRPTSNVTPAPHNLKRLIGKVESDNEDNNQDFASGFETDDDEFAGVYMDGSPSQVRAKIKRYIANTGCTQKRFQEEANVSAHSFTTFMRATGQNGSVVKGCHRFGFSRIEIGAIFLRLM